MDGGQRQKIEAKRPPYWSSQKAVVTELLSMKVLWDIEEYDPNNAFLIKENMWKRTDVKYLGLIIIKVYNKMDLKIN